MNKILQFLNYKNWGVKDYSGKGNFNFAYSTARQNGEKEFMWNGKRYSTNYNGTPEQQLKETGITDSQLHNRGLIEKKFTNNLYPFKYEYNTSGGIDNKSLIKRTISNIFVPDERRISINNLKPGELFTDTDGFPISYNDAKARMDAFNTYVGLPQKVNTFGISSYKPSIHKDDDSSTIYYKINDDNFYNNIIKQVPNVSKENLIFLENVNKKYNFTNDEMNLLNSLYSSKKTNQNKYSVYDDPVTKAINLFLSKNVPKNDFQKYLSILKDKMFLNETRASGAIDNPITGNYQVSLGNDEKGNYITYYDKWDIDPIKYINSDFGKPFEIYDRIYYKDYGDGKNKRMYYSDKELSELNSNNKNFDTLALQRELSNRGYSFPKSTKNGNLDGIYGDETKNALLDWQNKNKMKIIKDKKGGSSKNWIQKAVNPEHKGYCTPISKSTCTPHRKALAKRFKAMAKHEEGGSLDFIKNLCEKYKSGGKLSLKKHKEGGTIDLSKILSIWKK